MKLGIPCVMCITNDDATKNGNKCNNMMKKKMIEKGERKQKKKEMMKKL
jgi:hypothetical protein